MSIQSLEKPKAKRSDAFCQHRKVWPLRRAGMLATGSTAYECSVCGKIRKSRRAYPKGVVRAMRNRYYLGENIQPHNV